MCGPDLPEKSVVRYPRIGGCVTFLWAAFWVLFYPQWVELKLYEALHIRERCRQMELEEQRRGPHEQ